MIHGKNEMNNRSRARPPCYILITAIKYESELFILPLYVHIGVNRKEIEIKYAINVFASKSFNFH